VNTRLFPSYRIQHCFKMGTADIAECRASLIVTITFNPPFRGMSLNRESPDDMRMLPADDLTKKFIVFTGDKATKTILLDEVNSCKKRALNVDRRGCNEYPLDYPYQHPNHHFASPRKENSCRNCPNSLLSNIWATNSHPISRRCSFISSRTRARSSTSRSESSGKGNRSVRSNERSISSHWISSKSLDRPQDRDRKHASLQLW